MRASISGSSSSWPSALTCEWRYPGDDAGAAAVYEEMRQAMPGAIAGITWERLEREGSVTYPVA